MYGSAVITAGMAMHTSGHKAAGKNRPAGTRFGSPQDMSVDTTDTCLSKVDGDSLESAECARALQLLVVDATVAAWVLRETVCFI
jgi:hypothetical protein